MRKGAICTFFLLALLSVSDGLRAETQFGLNGLQTWTDNEQIEHPLGAGFYISQSVSGRIRLQFDYGYNYESRKFVATFYRGLPPFQEDTVRASK